MSKKKPIPKTIEETRRNFRHVIQSLEISSRSYDGGFKGEAARLAGLVFMLVQDGGRRTVSLLSQVGRKQIGFVNTCRGIDPKNLLTEAPLVIMRMSGSGMEYCPRLADDPFPAPSDPILRFSKWWEMPVLRDKERRLFSRKNIVWHMRNGEGGGHVDPTIDEQFADFERNNSMGWYVRLNGKEFAPEYSPIYATARQIAWEVKQTLRNNCSDLIAP
jgi:hypothetical protein